MPNNIPLRSTNEQYAEIKDLLSQIKKKTRRIQVYNVISAFKAYLRNPDSTYDSLVVTAEDTAKLRQILGKIEPKASNKVDGSLIRLAIKHLEEYSLIKQDLHKEIIIK